MTKIARLRLVAGLAMVAAAIGIGTAQGADVTMNLAWGSPDDHPYGRVARDFAAKVKDYSKGSVEARLFCCLKLGDEQEMVKKLQLGTLDATLIAQNNVGPFFPLFDLFALPYLFQSYQHAEKVIDGPIAAKVADKMVADAGIHLLGVHTISFRSLYNTKRPITSLDEVKGLRYRVPKNAVVIATYQALGVDPTPLPWGETLTATQTGIVDGGDLDIVGLYANKFSEVAKHLALTEQFTFLPVMLAGDKFMKKLNAEQAAAVRKAAKEASATGRKDYLQQEADILAKMKGQGLQVTAPDKKPFIAAATKVQDEFAAKLGADAQGLVADIRKAVQ